MKITLRLLAIIIMSNTLLFTVTLKEFNKIAKSHKMINTSTNKIIPIHFEIQNKSIIVSAYKFTLDDMLFINPYVEMGGKKEFVYSEGNGGEGIENYDQRLIATICFNNKLDSFITVVTSSSYNSKKYGKSINYNLNLFNIKDNNFIYDNLSKVIEKSFEKHTSGMTLIPYNSDYFYPYYNEKEILERLYETNTCDRETTKRIKFLAKGREHSLIFIEKILKQKKQLQIYNKEFFIQLLREKPIKKKSLTLYNNIAYYLQKAKANKEAIYLLEKILKKYPNRTVAHYNLADAYWALGEKKRAIASYTTYIKQMKANGKEKRIPKVVRARVSSK